MELKRLSLHIASYSYPSALWKALKTSEVDHQQQLERLWRSHTELTETKKGAGRRGATGVDGARMTSRWHHLLYLENGCGLWFGQ